jgi:hypothetical protein
MASVDAIAFVGDTLVSLLQSGLAGLVPPSNITLSTPAEFKTFVPAQPAVTIFLYHAGINGEMRNALRAVSDAGPTRRPPLPIDVRFLITPWTPVTRDAYRIIGRIASLLADNAVLGYSDLTGGRDVWSPDDTVALVLESLPIEQHHDIWAPSEIPYRLSLTYLARVVGLDSTSPAGAPTVMQADFVPAPP